MPVTSTSLPMPEAAYQKAAWDQSASTVLSQAR